MLRGALEQKLPDWFAMTRKTPARFIANLLAGRHPHGKALHVNMLTCGSCKHLENTSGGPVCYRARRPGEQHGVQTVHRGWRACDEHGRMS